MSLSCCRYSFTYFSARLKISRRCLLYNRLLFSALANDLAFNLAARCLLLRMDSGTDGNLAARPVFLGAVVAGAFAAGLAALNKTRISKPDPKQSKNE